MAKHVGFGVPGMHSERLDAERVARMGSRVPEEEQEQSSVPSFGAGTGHSSAKSRGSRKTHSPKEQQDLQHAGYPESSASERQPLVQSGGRNEILEQQGVGVATFNEPGASSTSGTDRQHDEDDRARGGSAQNYGRRCPLGGSQAFQRQDDRSFDEDSQRKCESENERTRREGHHDGSDRHEVYAKDSDLGATRKESVPLGDDAKMPMVSPPTSQLNTKSPYTTAATMKSSQFNSNDPSELNIHDSP